MKKLIGVYKCRYCGKLNEVESSEGALPDDCFTEPFDNRLFNLHEDGSKVTTWVIKDNKPYSVFKTTIIRHCNLCEKSVVLLDLVSIYLKSVG